MKKLTSYAIKLESILKKRKHPYLIYDAEISLKSIYPNMKYSDFLNALNELKTKNYIIANGLIQHPVTKKSKPKIDALPQNIKIDPQLAKYL
jgi:hypothetical protein